MMRFYDSSLKKNRLMVTLINLIVFYIHIIRGDTTYFSQS